MKMPYSNCDNWQLSKVQDVQKLTPWKQKRKYLADAAAKQAALSNQIIQTQECSSLPDKSIKDSHRSKRQLQKRRYGNKKEFLTETNISLEPNGKKLILPIGIQWPILQHVHELTH